MIGRNFFTLVEEIFENVVLQNARKLHDFAAIKLHDFNAISSLWLENILICFERTVCEEHFTKAAVQNALQLYDWAYFFLLWLKKALKMWHFEML